MDRQKVIRQLRAKADSTTFPAEAQALREKANKLEAKYGRPKERVPPWIPQAVPTRQPTMSDLNEMIKSMHFGRPMTGGILLINGQAVRVDGVGPITVTVTSNRSAQV